MKSRNWQVSVATVSRVLNGKSHVNPAIQTVVLQAAAELEVDVFKRNKARALAFILSNCLMLHPFHSSVLSGAEAYGPLQARTWWFLSFNYPLNHPWNELHLPKVAQRRDVICAVIVAGTNSTNLTDLLDHKGIPYVALGNSLFDRSRAKGNLIFADDTRGAADVTRYLLSLGHAHVWFVGKHAPSLVRALFCGLQQPLGCFPSFFHSVRPLRRSSPFRPPAATYESIR